MAEPGVGKGCSVLLAVTTLLVGASCKDAEEWGAKQMVARDTAFPMPSPSWVMESPPLLPHHPPMRLCCEGAALSAPSAASSKPAASHLCTSCAYREIGEEKQHKPAAKISLCGLF